MAFGRSVTLGSAVRLRVRAGFDVSSATALSVELRAPSGTKKSLAAVVDPTDDERFYAQCLVSPVTLDEAGSWTAKGKVSLSGQAPLYSPDSHFEVTENRVE